MTKCHCAGTRNVVVNVTGRITWRGQPRGDLGKQTVRVQKSLTLHSSPHTLTPFEHTFTGDLPLIIRLEWT